MGRIGPYEMRIAVRNTALGDQNSIAGQAPTSRETSAPQAVKIGSATEFVEVPDLKKKPFALSGILLQKDGAAVPDGIRTGAEGKTFEMSYRPPVEGDPAIRQFHAGENIAYKPRLFAADYRAADGGIANPQ